VELTDFNVKKFVVQYGSRCGSSFIVCLVKSFPKKQKVKQCMRKFSKKGKENFLRENSYCKKQKNSQEPHPFQHKNY